MANNEFDSEYAIEIARFETVWDRGIVGAMKAAFRLIGETLIHAGTSICDRTKTPALKRLDYIFSEGHRRAIDIAGGVPVSLLGDIDYEQDVMTMLLRSKEESATGLKLLR
jgi:hypothetical protein